MQGDTHNQVRNGVSPECDTAPCTFSVPMDLTEHFSLEELSHSEVALRHGIANVPSVESVDNLMSLSAVLLEPIRWLLECPLHVNSGYRNGIVNTLVGGSGNSAHMEGRACDFVPQGKDLVDCFHRIRRTQLPYDQLILECNAWIHVAIAKEGEEPRREALVASGGPQHWSYTRLERL